MKHHQKLLIRRVALIFLALPFFGYIAHCQNSKFNIGASAVLTINKQANLVVNCDVDDRGTIVNNGSIVLHGNSAQAFPGAVGTITNLNTLELRNTAPGVSLNKLITINNELKLTIGNLALSNNDITIESRLDHTAFISPMGPAATFSYGTGRFMIERYINVGNTG